MVLLTRVRMGQRTAWARQRRPAPGGTFLKNRCSSVARHQRPLGRGKSLQPGVERLVGLSEPGQEARPALLVDPAVDGQEATPSAGLAEQVRAEVAVALVEEPRP